MEYVETFREVDRKKIILAAKASLRQPEGKEALNYLKNKRQFSDDIIDRFNFGYCPLHINHQLRGRIITPIYDQYGNLIVISTRHLNENHPQRFWHESFDKSQYIYGLYYAKSEIIRCKKVIIVEGEFDVASLHSHNIKMTVAVCGSSFSLIQAAILARYCSEIFIVFDGDTSGKKATKRALQLYYKNNLEAYNIKYIPVYLPENMDPDEYMKEQGVDNFKKILIEARNQKNVK